jgi:hypothetical protein
MKTALVLIVLAAVACLAFAQGPKPELQSGDKTLLAPPPPMPPPPQSIEARLREVDIKLAIEQYERVMREAQASSFELMKLDAIEVDQPGAADARKALERRAMHLANTADQLRAKILAKYGKRE